MAHWASIEISQKRALLRQSLIDNDFDRISYTDNNQMEYKEVWKGPLGVVTLNWLPLPILISIKSETISPAPSPNSINATSIK